MNNAYSVALWRTRLSPSPIGTWDIVAESPRMAATIAMINHNTIMGVIVVMDAERQYTFFDAEWRDDELYFSKQETWPRLAHNPFITQSKKWRA